MTRDDGARQISLREAALLLVGSLEQQGGRICLRKDGSLQIDLRAIEDWTWLIDRREMLDVLSMLGPFVAANLRLQAVEH